MSEQRVLYRQVTSDSDLHGQTAVRWDVFVIEQKVPLVLEVDARDFLASTIQIVSALEGGEVIGSARVLLQGGRPAQFQVGRVAVRKEWRGRGVGEGLIAETEARARATVPEGEELVLTLDAQIEAEGFYRKLGYVPTARERFWDAGILHQEMEKKVVGTA